MSKKLLSMLLAAGMVLSIAPMGVFAAPEQAENVETVYEASRFSDPILGDWETPVTVSRHTDEAVLMEDAPSFSSVEKAAAYVKEKMQQRTAQFEIHYDMATLGTFTGLGNAMDALRDISSEIWNCVHAHAPGDPVGGDYIRYQMTYRCNIGASSEYADGEVKYIGTLTYTPDYYTSLAQEQELSAKIGSVLQSLNLGSLSDEQKVLAIYGYICDNVVYDYTNLNNTEYKLKYTAYAAMCDGTAVCQGYSNLLYRMLLEAGVDCRIISGLGQSGPHGWNIVKLGNRYYNVDSTWDSNYRNDPAKWQYFLRCDDTFVNHTRDEEYLTDSFMRAYPMSATDYVFGQEPGLPHVHSYTETSRQGSDCAGWTVYYTCSECGATDQQTLAPTAGHQYTETYRIGSDADGWTVHYTCSKCGASYEEKIDPAADPGKTVEPVRIMLTAAEVDRADGYAHFLLTADIIATDTENTATGLTIALTPPEGVEVEEALVRSLQSIGPGTNVRYYWNIRVPVQAETANYTWGVSADSDDFAPGTWCFAQDTFSVPPVVFLTNGDPGIAPISGDVLTYKVDLPEGVEGLVFIAWYRDGQMQGCDIAEAENGTHPYDAGCTYKLFLADRQGRPLAPSIEPRAYEMGW